VAGSSWGSFLGTEDGGVQSTMQSRYGVQSLFHALRDYQNVSVAVPGAPGVFRAVPDAGSTCVPCFETYALALLNGRPTTDLVDYRTPDGEVPEFVLAALADLTDRCNCYGTFPIPSYNCLHETAHAHEDTLFRCATPAHRVTLQLVALFETSEQDVQWWTDFIFATADTNGEFDRIAFLDIQVQTTLRLTEGDFEVGLRMAEAWDDWMDAMNAKYDIKGMVFLPGAHLWRVSEALVPSGISNMLVSLFLAFVVLTVASGNYVTSFLATWTIGMVVTVVLGFIQMAGWGLGPLESVLIVIVIGFSIDFTVHLADSYGASTGATRAAKVADALTHTGASVLSGAISTLGASLPLFGAQIIFFFKFGVFIFVTIGLSLLFSLGFFAAALSVAGPLGDAGKLPTVSELFVDTKAQEAAVERKIERAVSKALSSRSLPDVDAPHAA